LYGLTTEQEIELEDSLYIHEDSIGIEDLNEDLVGIMGEMLQD
jgi:hypothetical protein